MWSDVMNFLTSALIAMMALLVAPSVLHAETIPPGSYQQSCTGINADWRTLSATCRTRNGSWTYTELEDYRRCNADITNDNGNLRCADDDQGGDDDRQRDGDWRDQRDHNGWAPRGSYQQSCRNIDIDDGTLTAECQDRRGRWRYTELDDFRRCPGDITNADGMLRCVDGDRRGDDDTQDLPRGSWRASCRNYRLYGSVLYAECRTRYGRFSQSSIDVRQCRREISNVDGRLVCGDGYDGHERPVSITLFKHSNFDGKSRTITNDVPDLNVLGFGNIASSAVVQGGVWQVCDQPSYRGYCIVIDRSNSNFVALGFNDRAESVRRLR
jgi:hypothetical protein